MTTKAAAARPAVLCPDCGAAMMKAGGGWSGKHKKQMYRCTRCRRRWLNTQEPFPEKTEKEKEPR